MSSKEDQPAANGGAGRVRAGTRVAGGPLSREQVAELQRERPPARGAAVHVAGGASRCASGSRRGKEPQPRHPEGERRTGAFACQGSSAHGCRQDPSMDIRGALRAVLGARGRRPGTCLRPLPLARSHRRRQPHHAAPLRGRTAQRDRPPVASRPAPDADRASWLLDPETLSAYGIAKVRDVLARLEREGYPREHPRIIAGLPFSFWKGLFARRYEPLWRTRLRHAFPGAGLRREILEPLTSLHLWRNRIAHHDSLLGQDLERRLEEMIDVANAIDPACGQWLATHTEITVLLKPTLRMHARRNVTAAVQVSRFRAVGARQPLSLQQKSGPRTSPSRATRDHHRPP